MAPREFHTLMPAMILSHLKVHFALSIVNYELYQSYIIISFEQSCYTLLLLQSC